MSFFSSIRIQISLVCKKYVTWRFFIPIFSKISIFFLCALGFGIILFNVLLLWKILFSQYIFCYYYWEVVDIYFSLIKWYDEEIYNINNSYKFPKIHRLCSIFQRIISTKYFLRWLISHTFITILELNMLLKFFSFSTAQVSNLLIF